MSAFPPALGPVRDRAAEAAVFLDYDGTLAPLVDDPDKALPVPGVPALLAELGRRLGLVAVVSGRPAAFLVDVLGVPPGVLLVGLYGMEEAGADGHVERSTGLQRWLPVVARAVALAKEAIPQGAMVEDKGLSVTLHWRQAPQAQSAATALGQTIAAATGLVVHRGRMSLELRPPIDTDKGAVVRRLGESRPVVAVFGDDLGDLPAYEALDEFEAAGAYAVRVAVADAETAPEVRAAADVVVDGPAAAVEVLAAIAAG